MNIDRPFRLSRPLLCTGLLLLGSLLLVPSVAAQNVYTVDAIGDGEDVLPGDGTCATSGNDCTLRAAIQEANTTSNSGGPDEIHFDLSGSTPHTIQPGSELPEITDPVVIDGTTEPDYGETPVIELDGANTSSESGLPVISGGGLTAKGLSVVNFFNGFDFSGDDGGNVVQGCYIGVKPDGTTGGENNTGVQILSGASNTTIGGSGSGEGNVISGNATGLSVSAGATIQGNRIGVGANGNALGNVDQGIILVDASGATVGGTGSGEGNVVAHTQQGKGIVVTETASATNQNAIRGNQIYANSGLGIDLSNDGGTANDGDDTDDGENRLQNYPQIQSIAYDAAANEVTVEYLVDSDPDASGSGASAYPLTIDFYEADADAEEGKAYLGSDTYSASSPDDYGGCGSSPCVVSTTFTPSALLSGDEKLVATATDANDNTSEFSPASSKLPVELVAFGATQTGEGTVRLTWTTASEQNNAGFRIQRKVGPSNGAGDFDSGEAWQTVGRIDGAGTTTEVHTYRFTTDVLSPGTHQFRLQQVDLDGMRHSLASVTVDLKMQQTVRLNAPVPNPVRQRATLSFAVKEQKKTTITLFNALGQKVRTVYRDTPTAGEAQTARLDASTLASGTYFLRLQAGQTTEIRRLTVMR